MDTVIPKCRFNLQETQIYIALKMYECTDKYMYQYVVGTDHYLGTIISILFHSVQNVSTRILANTVSMTKYEDMDYQAKFH